MDTDKKRIKQNKLLIKYKYKKEKKKIKSEFINKKILDSKVKNSQSFFHLDFVGDDGLINLKNGEYARMFSIDALDLS